MQKNNLMIGVAGFLLLIGGGSMVVVAELPSHNEDTHDAFLIVGVFCLVVGTLMMAYAVYQTCSHKEEYQQGLLSGQIQISWSQGSTTPAPIDLTDLGASKDGATEGSFVPFSN